jgi:hypothetical protein
MLNFNFNERSEEDGAAEAAAAGRSVALRGNFSTPPDLPPSSIPDLVPAVALLAAAAAAAFPSPALPLPPILNLNFNDGFCTDGAGATVELPDVGVSVVSV